MISRSFSEKISRSSVATMVAMGVPMTRTLCFCRSPDSHSLMPVVFFVRRVPPSVVSRLGSTGNERKEGKKRATRPPFLRYQDRTGQATTRRQAGTMPAGTHVPTLSAVCPPTLTMMPSGFSFWMISSTTSGRIGRKYTCFCRFGQANKQKGSDGRRMDE